MLLAVVLDARFVAAKLLLRGNRFAQLRFVWHGFGPLGLGMGQFCLSTNGSKYTIDVPT
jgi:hypothetical protein